MEFGDLVDKALPEDLGITTVAGLGNRKYPQRAAAPVALAPLYE
ncbi:hypothetical protein [Pseudonocardia oceani]|nr:hypothetical protein [Pseudonocardia oceani]